MRKCALFFVLLALISAVSFSTVGCSDKKTTSDSIYSDSLSADTSQTDSLESIIADTPMPKAADELFDDFIFNFAANKRLQLRRIQFPLPVYKDNKKVQLTKAQWKMEHFFMHQEFYTLIFDNAKEMEVVKDTSVKNVVIEKINLENKSVKQYVFDRLNGQWMMTSIVIKPIQKNMNASFLNFYQRFSTDSLFQIQSMNDAVTFTAPDPDDDFSHITGTIAPEQWPAFKPAFIPHGTIYNILYGQKYKEGNKKIFVIRGIANGLETIMTFTKIGGAWKLVKFNY